MTRPDGRRPDELRLISFERDFTTMASGSVLVAFGDTRVLCTASVDDDVPRWMRGKGRGWVTAEYSMLPGSSPERVGREAVRGRQGGRTMEIQRLIGRAQRAACDMVLLGERQVIVDSDVLQADGGTRTASTTPSPGSCRPRRSERIRSTRCVPRSAWGSSTPLPSWICPMSRTPRRRWT